MRGSEHCPSKGQAFQTWDLSCGSLFSSGLALGCSHPCWPTTLLIPSVSTSTCGTRTHSWSPPALPEQVTLLEGSGVTPAHYTGLEMGEGGVLPFLLTIDLKCRCKSLRKASHPGASGAGEQLVRPLWSASGPCQPSTPWILTAVSKVALNERAHNLTGE